MPEGAFYLWARVPGGDAWAAADWLAREAGILVSPGDFYGDSSSDHIRVAMVQPDDRLMLAAQRLSAIGIYDASVPVSASVKS